MSETTTAAPAAPAASQDAALAALYPNTPAPKPPAPEPRDPVLEALYPSMYPAAAKAEPPAVPAPAQVQDQTQAQTTAQQPAAELPEAYRDLAAPEGFAVDAAAFSSVAPELERLGVSREQAEGLLTVYAKLEAADTARLQAGADAWRREAAAIPQGELQAARTALKGAPTELVRVLNGSRLGDHPATIRWLAGLTRTAGPAPVDLAALYPTMKGRR
jgi:hypothetical protein